MDVNRAYRVLGLAYGAGTDEVQAAWRDLAQVWHPDRFPADSRLRAKAEANLQRINEAREALRGHVPDAAGSGLVRRVRDSVIIGLGDLRDSMYTQLPPPGLQRGLRVVGLGPQRSRELRVRPFSRGRLWGSLAALALALLLLGIAVLMNR